MSMRSSFAPRLTLTLRRGVQATFLIRRRGLTGWAQPSSTSGGGARVCKEESAAVSSLEGLRTRDRVGPPQLQFRRQRVPTAGRTLETSSSCVAMCTRQATQE